MFRKRSVSLLLALVLVSMLALIPAAQAQDVVLRGYTKGQEYQYLYFGNYFTEKNGKVQPILWRVLATNSGKALLWSEYILDARPYLLNTTADDDRDSIQVEYADSTVCSFLNEEFIYTAFTPEQRDMLIDEGAGLAFILDEEQITNPLYGFKNGWSEADIRRYAFATPYAAENCYVGDYGRSNYWVATYVDNFVRIAHYIGSLGKANCFRFNVGIRVAIWVDIDQLTFTGGQGTIELPYKTE